MAMVKDLEEVGESEDEFSEKDQTASSMIHNRKRWLRELEIELANHSKHDDTKAIQASQSHANELRVLLWPLQLSWLRSDLVSRNCYARMSYDESYRGIRILAINRLNGWRAI